MAKMKCRAGNQGLGVMVDEGADSIKMVSSEGLTESVRAE